MILKEGLSKYFIFSKLNEEQLVEAVKHSQYLIFQAKEQIFNIGDSLEYFYVIVKGQVSQYCTEHSYEMAKNRQRQSSDIILATAESTNQKLFRIKILSEGDYLGEQALLNTEQNHQSALQALAEAPEVHLLAININMYKQYLQTASRNNLINDIQTMQSNNMFNKWEFDMIRLLYFFSVKQTFYNGQTVFKEDELSKAVFIILKGEFGIYKTFQQSEGRGIKSQGNKNHLSDEEHQSSSENEDNDTFQNRLQKKIKETSNSSGDEEQEEAEEEQQLFNTMSKTTDSSKPTSQQTQRNKKLSKKSLDNSLHFIDEIDQTETDYFKPTSKILDNKQIKSLSQIQKSDDQTDNLQIPLTSKKINPQNKLFLYPSKDDSQTPKMINNQPKHKLFQLYTLGLNQIFGEEDVMKKQKRSFTVKCNSYGGGVLLIIRKNIFNLSLLANNSSEIYLKKNLEMKEQRFSQRVKMVQENIQKYRNYFFENNAENSTPKNPLRAKRKLVEKDCINIDDFMRASKKQVVLQKSAQLYDLNMQDKQKKDNAAFFTAEMITEKINTFTSPNLKKIDLFNFKNDICKVENPPSIHTIFENQLKKVMKGQNGSNYTQNCQIFGQGASTIASIASNSQPNTQRNPNSLNIKTQQDAKFISKPQNQFHRPKLSDNNLLKVNEPFFQTSLSQNNSGLLSSTQLKSSTQMSYNQDNTLTLPSSQNPPVLKKQASKSDPNIKLPPSIELLNKMGQRGLHNNQTEQVDYKNPILAQKDQLKRELLLKQQIQKNEQANLGLNSPDKKFIQLHNSVNLNDGNSKPVVSRKNKALQESTSGSLGYVPPLTQSTNVPKMNVDTKPVKKTIFLDTFTKGFFKNMKGIFYKNYNNQQGSLNSYSSIQESIAKHVLDPSIKQFLKQNPGILASKEKQVEFLRPQQNQEKPQQKMNSNRAFLKSNPEFQQEDFATDYYDQEYANLKRPLSAKPQKSQVIKFNIFRSDQNSASSYKFDINKIKEQNNKKALISPDKKTSPNKFKRTYSAMELDANTEDDGFSSDMQFGNSNFNFYEENSKTSPLKFQMHSTALNFHSNQDKNHLTASTDLMQAQQEELLTQPITETSKRFYKKQSSLQPYQFDRQHHEHVLQPSQLLDNKITLQIPQKHQMTSSTSAIAFSTHHQNFFKPSPLKNTSNPMMRSQVISKTMNNLSPELSKNKGPINRIFGANSQTNSIDFSDKHSSNIPHLINLNQCQKDNDSNNQKSEEEKNLYQNSKNDLFRQKIENDKNLIKMTNLFIQQTPTTSKKPYKASL